MRKIGCLFNDFNSAFFKFARNIIKQRVITLACHSRHKKKGAKIETGIVIKNAACSFAKKYESVYILLLHAAHYRSKYFCQDNGLRDVHEFGGWRLIRKSKNSYVFSGLLRRSNGKPGQLAFSGENPQSSFLDFFQSDFDPPEAGVEGAAGAVPPDAAGGEAAGVLPFEEDFSPDPVFESDPDFL